MKKIIEILQEGALKANQAMESLQKRCSQKGVQAKLGERSKGHRPKRSFKRNDYQWTTF